MFFSEEPFLNNILIKSGAYGMPFQDLKASVNTWIDQFYTKLQNISLCFTNFSQLDVGELKKLTDALKIMCSEADLTIMMDILDEDGGGWV